MPTLPIVPQKPITKCYTLLPGKLLLLNQPATKVDKNPYFTISAYEFNKKPMSYAIAP